jgi:hypothetical protein
MSYLIAVYFPATESWDFGFKLLTFYLSMSELIVFTKWTVESCRARNRSKPARGAVLFGSISNITAIAFGTPLFYLLDILATTNPDQWWLTAAHVSPSEAKAILPAILIGMLAPTLLMFAPFLPSIPRQWMAIVWMFAPLYVYFLHNRFTILYARERKSPHVTMRASMVESVGHLKTLYFVVGLISAITHVLVIFGALQSDDTSLADIFSVRYFDSMSFYEGNHMMFLWDFYVTMAAALVWAFFSALSLGSSGIIRVNVFGLVLSLLVGSLLVGPAAAVAACCFWRDTRLADQTLKGKRDKLA